MDGQNFGNGFNDNQNVDTTPEGESVSVDTGSYSYQDNNVSSTGYSFQDNSTTSGSYNYQDNTTTSGSYNYQDNTTQYTTSVYSESDSQPSESTPGIAIASLIMSIISILICCCWGGGIVLAIPSLIMAISANKKQKTGVGTAGMICSIVGIVLNVIALIYYIVILVAAASGAM